MKTKVGGGGGEGELPGDAGHEFSEGGSGSAVD